MGLYQGLCSEYQVAYHYGTSTLFISLIISAFIVVLTE